MADFHFLKNNVGDVKPHPSDKNISDHALKSASKVRTSCKFSSNMHA